MTWMGELPGSAAEAEVAVAAVREYEVLPRSYETSQTRDPI